MREGVKSKETTKIMNRRLIVHFLGGVRLGKGNDFGVCVRAKMKTFGTDMCM